MHKVDEHKRTNHKGDTGIFTVVSVTCRSPLIHVEVDSMFNRSSIKPTLDLEPVRTKEPLHTSVPLELLFTAPVRRAPNLSQSTPGLLTSST